MLGVGNKYNYHQMEKKCKANDQCGKNIRVSGHGWRKPQEKVFRNGEKSGKKLLSCAEKTLHSDMFFQNNLLKTFFFCFNKTINNLGR